MSKKFSIFTGKEIHSIYAENKAHAKPFFPGGFLPAEERAQASAPFELFVAVIIMAFVVLMGYLVLGMVNSEICLNTVDKEMGKFKTALEDTVNRKSSKSFSFQPPTACFASKGTVMKIELEKNKKTCADRCGTPSDECYVMTFNNPAVANAFKQKCIDLPQYTSFLTDNCAEVGSDELSGSGFATTNPTADSLKVGQYVIRNVSPAGNTFPSICVWYKAGG